jgi:hypothetical protein
MSDSTDGLKLNTAAFDAAVIRFAMTSKKTAAEVMKDQARLLFVEVAKITPPYGGGASTGRKAEAQGKTAVSRDIYSLYGTRSDAYDAIASRNAGAAQAFWRHLGSNNEALANEILKDVTGKSLGKFDGGALHKRTAGGKKRRARARRETVFYVSNAEALAAYVREQKAHVWWLASGWGDALRTLGAKLPYGVDKQDSPGRLKVEINDQRIVITMVNQVSFGREVRDIERRINFALNKRVGALDRRWESYINRTAKDAGFAKSLR